MERGQAYSHWLSVDGCYCVLRNKDCETLKLQAKNCIAAKEQILYDVLHGVQE